MNTDIRWKQRFQNFEKAYRLMDATLGLKALSIAEEAGLVKFYELAFELAWKTLKDILENEGIVVKSPRQTFKEAFPLALIQDSVWLEMLDDRNILAHTYDEEIAKKAVSTIREKYFPAFRELYMKLKKKA